MEKLKETLQDVIKRVETLEQQSLNQEKEKQRINLIGLEMELKQSEIHSYTVKIKKETLHEIQQHSRKQKVSMRVLINAAIEEYLETLKKE